MQKEVNDAEVQLEMSNQEYYALQRKLEEMLATITREASDIKKLEQELRDGKWWWVHSTQRPFLSCSFFKYSLILCQCSRKENIQVAKCFFL